MSSLDINPEILKCLRERAVQAQCSVDELLTQLLDNPLQINDDQAAGFPLLFNVRKQAQEALRQSEERYRLLAQNVTDMISRHTPEGIFTYVTPSAQRLLGYAPEEMIGQSAYEFFHPDDLKAIQTSHQMILQQPLVNTIEYRIRRKDGQMIWFETTTHVVRDPVTGEHLEIISVSRDISERKQAQEALRQSEERYRIISELVSDYAYCFRVDADGQMTLEWITDAVEQVTGYRFDDPDSPPAYAIYHADDKTQAQQDVERVIQGEEVTSEYRILTKNDEIRWLRTVRRPIWDEQAGRVVRFYAVVQDITVEKQAEQIRLEQERLKANLKKEKEFNALIQKAVSALSHDIRTPLAVIATAKDILGRYFDRLDEDQRRERLSSIGKQLRYVVELLDDVTMTIKGNLDADVFRPEPVNLAALCAVSINEIQETAGSKHRLRFVTDEQITTATVDETLVNRILLNLLSNAVKFSPETSEIRLELNRRDEWIVLRVVDQGIGIAQEDQAHIFEPFYRANSARKVSGTGLGLSIVEDCVIRHHGHVSVESQVGQGAAFTVELPLVAG